jgi:uracil-DNA glycosylase
VSKPLFLLGEAFGSNEAKLGYGFVGASGVELLRMLHDATIIELSAEDRSFISRFWNTGDPACIDAVWRLHPELYRANVFPFHPPGNNLETLCGPRNEGISGYPALTKSKFLRREFIPHLEALGDEILSVDPNLIVCLGNTPLWALAGATGISRIRGTTRLSTHTCVGYKLLPTYHPAAVLRQWEFRPTTVMDLMKAAREAEFPEVRRPKREIWIEPDPEDIERFINEQIIECEILAVDIETSGNLITCIGFAPSRRSAIVIPFYDGRRNNHCYWINKQAEQQVWGLVAGVLGRSSIKKVFQNGLYDIAFLWRSVGIPVFGAEHDTMLAHHALQPESLKGLAFLGSAYTDEGPWKTERKVSTIKADQ